VAPSPKSEPTDEEMAAIAAAVEMAWPRPVVVVPAAQPRKLWRWSGRWWGPRAVPAERRRPWM
jgi:hypothetical protein